MPGVFLFLEPMAGIAPATSANDQILILNLLIIVVTPDRCVALLPSYMGCGSWSAILLDRLDILWNCASEYGRFSVRLFSFLGTHHSFNLTVRFIAPRTGYLLSAFGAEATLTIRSRLL